jgi:actin-like ATPase involved in cell morphogenesis
MTADDGSLEGGRMTGPGDGFVLGVDLGTSHTVAMLRHPGGRVRPLLFDGQPLLRSAVFLDTGGKLHVGADALRLGYADPGRLQAHPKRLVGAGTIRRGETSVAVSELLAALLDAVGREAVAAVGVLPPAVLTHPAFWGDKHRSVLTEALGKAGWPAGTRLVPGPVAAARYYAEVLARPSSPAVFDFGAGSLDVAVVRDGRVTASGGASDLGGLDLDAALVEYLGKSLAGSEPEAWHALAEPVTLGQWRARRQLWEDVRGAKEMLSRGGFAPVPVPGVEHAVELTREELEAVVDPLVRRAVAEAAQVIEGAAELFLVGGSTRVPMVARLLRGELGIAPTVVDQPELAIAEGAALLAEGGESGRGTTSERGTRPEPGTKSEPALADGPESGESAGLVTATSPVPRAATAITDTRVEDPTDERLRATPVDPWATAEAAALPTMADLPGGWASPPGGPLPTTPAGSPVAGVTTPPAAARRRRLFARPYMMIVAVSLVVVLAAGALLAWVFWPGYGALDYHPLSEPRRIPAVVPVSSDWSDAEIIGDRAYFASSSTQNGAVGVVAMDIGASKPAWTSTAAGTAQRWETMVALPVGIALFSDTDSLLRTRRIAILGAGRGDLRWQRTIADDDEVLFAGDTAVVTDHAGKRLLGLKLTDGKEQWSRSDPGKTAPAVLTVTTWPTRTTRWSCTTDG